MQTEQETKQQKTVSYFTRVKRFCLKTFLLGLLALGICGYFFHDEMLSEAKAYLSETWDLVQIVEVPKDYTEIDLKTLIKTTSRAMGMPSYLTLAIIRQESGVNMRHDRMRLEPHLISRFKKQAWENDIEHQAKATSFGLMQVVYGIHKERCHLKSYADLFNPEINLKCGIHVFKDCFSRQKAQDKVNRVKGALLCYNGGKTYPDQVLGKLGEIILE